MAYLTMISVTLTTKCEMTEKLLN